MPIPRNRTSPADAAAGIRAILLATFVLGVLYLGRDILIPIALASLFTFLLAPLVSRVQRWLGRIAAVLVVVAMVVALATAGGWVLTRQLVQLASDLPSYEENIRTKLRAFQLPENEAFTRLSETFEDLKKELPGASPQDRDDEADLSSPLLQRDAEPPPTRVQIVDVPDATAGEIIRIYLAPAVGPLGTAALVLLLLIFMLLKREDLRSRVIRLIGQGRISATTRVMDDAGARVSRYLLMLLVVNVTYGIPVAIGLYFIGIPNAILWGSFAIILRFIPYVGPWIAASFPVLLSIAVSPDWITPMMTISLFIVLEILSNNVMEPWLYGASTGVTPVALILAAVFWTWMWGPVGLVLATPITVCLVVMGRYIPSLSFLSIMLSDEDALTPAEDCYHRLLRVGEHDEMELVDQYLRSHSRAELYDGVLVPVVIAAEADRRVGLLDEEQRGLVFQGLREIIEDLSLRHGNVRPKGEELAKELRPDCHVHLIPARAERDELAADMLSQLLAKGGFEVRVGSGRLSLGEKAAAAAEMSPDVVCVSVVAPTRVVQARILCKRVRELLPGVKIVVGFWGAPEEAASASAVLREAGADEVVSSFAGAEDVFRKVASPLAMQMEAAGIPPDEDERLEAMAALNLEDPDLHARMKAHAVRAARIFGVEIVIISAIGRDRQVFLAQHGLPADLEDAGGVSRELSICGHVVARDEVLVVEDLVRDRRFANNPLVKDHGFRFYAGEPLRMPGGGPAGSLCLIGLAPRRFTPQEIRLLDSYAAEVSEEMAGVR